LGDRGALFWINCARHYNPGILPEHWAWRDSYADFPMKKVIELIRVSTEGQAADDRASIPAQKAVNRRTCAQFGLEIVRSIEIADVSGARVLLAPEMKQLVESMQSPEIHGVVAREFSRLMRPENFGDYALLQVFADTKTVLYLPEGPLDLSNKQGRFMGAIRAAMAGMERTEILERIWTAKEEKRRRGELAQSSIVLPWGVGYDATRGFYYKPEADRMREVFRQFLAGNQSYSHLSKLIGVTPRGLHIIMRNPIWTGWRVIDKKRDSTAAGRYVGQNGRQADRRKIARAPEDVIRVQVIAKPLISDSDFQCVQRIMDLKQKRHWRSQPELEHRFTYNGFLTCSGCGEMIHTAFARRDYYICKGRRIAHKCDTKYMDRTKLEALLDALFAESLTDRGFLDRCVEELKGRWKHDDSAVRTQRLTAQLTSLRGKRARVIDTFLEGVITREDRDLRLAPIDRDIEVCQSLLMQTAPCPMVATETLVEAFSDLLEWKYWTRDQKRSVLAALTPDIRVANYQVTALGLNSAVVSNENTRSGTDSLQSPA
jgi:DNA invertase Pin-like site-specific DNA recombinase